jgi:hypothetical protein
MNDELEATKMGTVSALMLAARMKEENRELAAAAELMGRALNEAERLFGPVSLMSGYVLVNLQYIYEKLGALSLSPRIREILISAANMPRRIAPCGGRSLTYSNGKGIQNARWRADHG